MMLIFEEIQINTSDRVYQKPLPPPLLELALFGMISKEIRRLREAVILK